MDPVQDHGWFSDHRVGADFSGTRIHRVANDINRVNIEPDESMLKHSRDLPSFTCGTTIAPPMSHPAKGTVSGNLRNM
ncbi:hypothetical protein StoSoilB20_19670 [Arthrobacter sp. StoSoilB20]|nr:hypothetical protein StoSoilB20_19670 [Arthrobacter sp. StoSoilB20]